MPRNFHVSRRSMSGGSTSTGSHGADTRANTNSSLSVLEFPSASVRPNLPGDARSFLDEMRNQYQRQHHFVDGGYNVGAGLLWLGLIVVPWIIVLGLVFAYMAFIA